MTGGPAEDEDRFCHRLSGIWDEKKLATWRRDQAFASPFSTQLEGAAGKMWENGEDLLMGNQRLL